MCMTVVGAPQVAMQLVSMVYLAYQASPDVLEQTLDCSEYFAGGMQVTRAWAELSYNVCPFEILLNPEVMDILSIKGRLGNK
ncbi:unnamed protein product [Effrenium voratum]|uniref:Uncharacterized protein n=1 Tax=Effrenium voratum TaxID=2562239 RepID=A0AA36MSF4_9DINO|nr:unnamed protein product [Effrenium voratum]